MPDSRLGSQAARFHLKDGRTLIFQTLRPSLFRRRAGEITLALLVALLGLIARSLLAKGRPDARSSRPAEAALSARSAP